MKLTFLGTGTSQGVPVVGCSCQVCTSSDPEDKRLRCSVLVQKEDFSLLIDISPDFRQQMLRGGFDRVDAICISHEHNDHVNGLDDIRPINFKWGKDVPLYALPRVASDLHTRFYYAFTEGYKARPRLAIKEVQAGEGYDIGPFHVDFIEVMHGDLPILGFIIDGRLAYLTDVKRISSEYTAALQACDVVIMSALQKELHYTHQTLEEAISLATRLDTKTTYFTHMSHTMGRHQDVRDELSDRMQFAYDGLEIHMDDK